MDLSIQQNNTATLGHNLLFSIVNIPQDEAMRTGIVFIFTQFLFDSVVFKKN